MNPTNPPVTPAPIGWLETMKQSLSWENLSQRFNLSLGAFVEVLVYGGIGLLTGFFVKKYGKYVLLILLIAGAIIAGLAHIDIVTFDWVKAKTLLGISDDNAMAVYGTYIKEHMFQVISFSVGFIVGLFI